MVFVFIGLIGIAALFLAQLKGAPIQFNDPLDCAAARHQLHFYPQHTLYLSLS